MNNKFDSFDFCGIPLGLEAVDVRCNNAGGHLDYESIPRKLWWLMSDGNHFTFSGRIERSLLYEGSDVEACFPERDSPDAGARVLRDLSPRHVIDSRSDDGRQASGCGEHVQYGDQVLLQ